MSALLAPPPVKAATLVPRQQQTLTYEKINVTSLERLHKIAYKTFDETFAPHNPPEVMKAYMDKAFDYAQLANELNDYQNHFYLVKYGQAVIGYFKLTIQLDYQDIHIPTIIKNGHGIMLERFYLDSAYHGNGIAHQMMQECLDTAIRMDYDRIWLGVWEKNLRAQKFYKKWGFEQVGTHPFIMGEEIQTDHWLSRPIQ